MKKSLKLVVCLLILFGATQTFAQIKVGGSVYYASKIENAGINLSGSYSFSDEFSAVPSFTYFFKKDNLKWSMLDLDVNYIFTELDFAYVYALGGLNITFWELFGLNGSNAGLNLGLGLAMPLSDYITFSPEFKYTIREAGFYRFGIKLMIEI